MSQSIRDELTQVMGIGSVGEVRQGPDGNPYQWVQGIDGLGNPVGFWRGLKRLRRRLRKVVPLVQQVAPFVPALAPAAAALRVATQAGVAGDGLGAVYQSPAGELYQIQGLEADDELQGLEADDELQGLEADDELQGLEADDELQGLEADDELQGLEADDELQGLEADDELQGLEGDELTQVMGIGSVGEVRQGPDGNPYQWVQGIDGLGNPVGFWRGLKRLRRRLRKVVPLVQQVAPFVPALAPAAAALRVATQAGVAGDGLGAVYQSPAGELYQIQGLEADDELQGLEADDELQGLEADDELQGLEADDELQGFEGYVREDGSQLGAYTPQQPTRTPWFTPPPQPPEMWRPMW